jgi:hypothetical protein
MLGHEPAKAETTVPTGRQKVKKGIKAKTMKMK